jgi:Type I phosphodiesterase / nucleotide pyrophosphatase
VSHWFDNVKRSLSTLFKNSLIKFKKTLLSLAVSMALSVTAIKANTVHEQENSAIKHVLLISVDGLHQNDLDWYVANNPNSAMAAMVTNGITYNNARTPFPSDSFPGMVGQTTGGNPKTTGIYYDDAYSRGLLPSGTSKADCQGKLVTLGTAVTYAENIEPTNADGQIVLDSTQGITGLYPVVGLEAGKLSTVPTNILKLVSGADDLRNNLIDPNQLPIDPVSCNPVYPHQYLQVNTIFEVAHAKGLRTAWTDKHPAYEILNGPSGYSIDDLFAPEINSVIDLKSSKDWTKNNANTQKYDTIKVLSVINEINGYDHSGKNKHGTPAIFGMNFQAVSTAQKLNTSPTPENTDPNQLGGYTNNGTIPGPVLQSALNFVDESLKQMQDAINSNKKTQSNTVIILSAKHGQSPQDRSKLTLIDDGKMLDDLQAAWAATNPKITNLVAHAMDDDGGIVVVE